jgi:hypothetical protein
MWNTKWVFGKDAGLNFSGGAVTPFSNRPIFATEGCASISDSSGNLVLYSDGLEVRDGAGNLRIVGLQGNQTSTEAAVAVPDPAHANRYYVFTSDATSVAKHVDGILVDTSSGAWTWQPLSALMTMPPTVGYSPTEKLVAIRRDKKSYWVLTVVQTPVPPNGILRVFLITVSGVSWFGDQPLLQNVDPVGYMKASLGGRRLALANFGNADLLVVPFSITTGLITPSGVIKIPTIPLPGTYMSPCPYGVEFSPSNERLYFTTVCPFNFFNSPSTDGLLFQFSLPSGPKVLVGTHPKQVTALVPTAGLGALQYAPDGRIYIAQIGEQKLGVIAHPDVPGTACGVTFSAVTLQKSSRCLLGMPNFIRELF